MRVNLALARTPPIIYTKGVGSNTDSSYLRQPFNTSFKEGLRTSTTITVFGTMVGRCTRIRATKAILSGGSIKGQSSHSSSLFNRWRIRKYTSSTIVTELSGGMFVGTHGGNSCGNLGVGARWREGNPDGNVGGGIGVAGGTSGIGCMGGDNIGGGASAITLVSQFLDGDLSSSGLCDSLGFSGDLIVVFGGDWVTASVFTLLDEEDDTDSK